MPLYLHRNLAALVRVTAKEDYRYTATCVHVLNPGDGTYRVEATDGKRLAIVRGNSVDGHSHHELASVPDGAEEALVGRDDWQRGFKMAAGKYRGPEPALFLALHQQRLTFASQGQVVTAIPQEGRYPNVDGVLPTKPPLLQFRVDPALLASLLDTVGSLGMETVDVLYYGKDKPLGLVARNDAGQWFDGLIMPLTPA